MKCFKRTDKLCALLITFSVLFITDMDAQKKTTISPSPEVMAWAISTMEPWPPDKYKSAKEAMIDNKIFPPLVFRGGMFQPLDTVFCRDSLRLGAPIPPAFRFQSKRMRPMFRYETFLKSLDDGVYKKMLENPRLFKYTIWQLPGTVVKAENIERPRDSIKVAVQPSIEAPKVVDPVLKFIPDRKYWTSASSLSIQFSQNKSSANWRGGEINNLNLVTSTNTTYNYRKNKVSLDNTLKTNFSVVNSPKDTLRKYTIGTDVLNFRSNFGLTAIKNWNYSSSLDFTSAMGNRYIANTKRKQSAFLAPFTVVLGLGMTYKVVPAFKKPNRSVDLTLSLEPLAFSFVYSITDSINLPAYFPRREDGTYPHFSKAFGPKVTMIQNTRFNKSMTLYTLFSYLTNYERVQSELENRLNIQLNRYFSMVLHVFLRYDDGVRKVEGKDTYLQNNEIFTFGFAYSWK